MKERPIIFTDEMVHAILDGRKTQTRRPVKQCKQFADWDATPGQAYDVIETDSRFAFLVTGDYGYTEDIACPYGQPGDRLWARECWTPFDVSGDESAPWAEIGYRASNDVRPSGVSPLDFGASKRCPCSDEDMKKLQRAIAKMDTYGDRWSPSIHMPRWASRITLEIVRIRVERVQDISVEDCIAEGLRTGFVEHDAKCHLLEQFSQLWDSIYGATEYAWENNPWVWVVEFRRVEA